MILLNFHSSLLFTIGKVTGFIIVITGLAIMDSGGLQFAFRHFPNGSYVWNGCLYKKARWLRPAINTRCGQCIENGTRLVKNADKYYMTYRNCTHKCQQPTICTEYKYNIDGVKRSECYVCEGHNYDNIVYRALPFSEICGDACRKCASNVDFSSAVSCHKFCNGRPTFCPPNQKLFFGQKICYQSRRLHGCHYGEVDREKIKEQFEGCVECASKVDHDDADKCSHFCGNRPTWHSHQEDDNNTSNSSRPTGPRAAFPSNIVFMQCKIPAMGKVLNYEIPTFIRGLLKDIKTKNRYNGLGDEDVTFVSLKKPIKRRKRLE